MAIASVNKVANLNVKQRSEKYPNGMFHESNSIVFCTMHYVPVGFNKKASCDKHLENALHK